MLLELLSRALLYKRGGGRGGVSRGLHFIPSFGRYTWVPERINGATKKTENSATKTNSGATETMQLRPKRVQLTPKKSATKTK